MKSRTTECRSHETPREDKHAAGLRLDKVHITVPARTWVHEHLCASGPHREEAAMQLRSLETTLPTRWDVVESRALGNTASRVTQKIRANTF
jgi:hypothetical protein